MVYDKKRSGDPDLDDKQPPEFHAGSVVSAGDGVFITPQGGAVDVNGAHVNLAEAKDAGDNRPAPGEVASETSSVTVAPEVDASAGVTKADPATVAAIKAGQAATIKAGQDTASGGPGATPEPAPAKKSTAPAK